jgi:hypothetical protein
MHEELSISQLVLANRPWRLVRDLSRVLVAILGSAGFFIVSSNAWLIADGLNVARLLVIAVTALGAPRNVAAGGAFSVGARL